MNIDPLLRKLEQFAPLSEGERHLLERSVSDVAELGPNEDLTRQGDSPKNIHLLLDGWAGRYKILPNGDRQIMALLIPGDICDLHVALLEQMDHSIGTLSPCRVAYIPDKRFSEMLLLNPRLAKFLWWSVLVDEAITREWLVNIGGREADQRVAHFICEMLLRSRAVGLSDNQRFRMPLTQEQLADTMGMSPVHMNRTLQALRGQNLIESEGRQVEVSDLPRLMQFCGFDPMYLHQLGSRLGLRPDRVV